MARRTTAELAASHTIPQGYLKPHFLILGLSSGCRSWREASSHWHAMAHRWHRRTEARHAVQRRTSLARRFFPQWKHTAGDQATPTIAFPLCGQRHTRVASGHARFLQTHHLYFIKPARPILQQRSTLCNPLVDVSICACRCAAICTPTWASYSSCQPAKGIRCQQLRHCCFANMRL